MVIPLLSMFFWTHAKVKHMSENMSQDMVNILYTKLKTTSTQYLELQESDILSKIYEKNPENITLKELQNLLDEYQVEQLSPDPPKVLSYYETRESEQPGLYSVTVLPLKNSKTHGIKISSKVDVNELHPGGPFGLDVFYLDKNNKKILEEHIEDPAIIHRMKKHHSRKPFRDANLVNNVLEIKGENGKPVARIVIIPEMPPPPGFIFDNALGLIILFAGIILSLITGFYINKSFIRPLLRISEATKSVAKGDLSFRLPIDVRQKYILDTYINFNNMITGLKEKDDLRKNFISNLSHDLRTPLLAQERSLDLIAQKFQALGVENEYELAKSLEKNNSHLLRMVNLILNSYSFDSAQLKLVLTDINISEFIDNCYEKLKPLIVEKNILFKNEIPEDRPPIKGDAISFERIFINLISNAIENTPKNGEIKVYSEANPKDNYLKIYVEDNGNGISDEDLGHIFDRYYSGKSFERQLGAGLGLDVCKKLIEMHNGGIEVESKLGHYTKFIVTFPLDMNSDYKSKKEHHT